MPSTKEPLDVTIIPAAQAIQRTGTWGASQPTAPNFIARATKLLKIYRGATDTLIGGQRGLHIRTKDDKLFLRSMKEAFAHHYLGCYEFRALCEDAKFYPWNLKRLDQLHQIPYFFVTALKYFSVRSVPRKQIALTLKSSGTTGQTSAIVLDKPSLRRIRRIVRNIYDEFDMVDERRTNYLCFTYDPDVACDVGTAFSDKLLTGLTKVQSVFYAIEWDEAKNDWALNSQRVEASLDAFEADGRPFRLLGFPAHTWQVLEEIVARRGRPYTFGPRSYVITGGGWKNFDGQVIAKHTFREGVAQRLGIPAANVRDLYGMVEHGVPYCECEKHRFHIPRYSRVFVRDPATLEVLPNGESGLLQFVTSYHHSYPAISLLTTDIGRVEDHCPCGRLSPVLVLEGRGGLRKHQGCAISALKVQAQK